MKLKTFEEFAHINEGKDTTGREIKEEIFSLYAKSPEDKEIAQKWLDKNWKPEYNNMVFGHLPNLLLYKKLEKMKSPKVKKRGGYKTISVRDPRVSILKHDKDKRWTPNVRYKISAKADSSKNVFIIYEKGRNKPKYFVEDEGIYFHHNVPQRITDLFK